MMTITPSTRLLAIDPTNRGFAWVLLEGADRLVDWGTVSVPSPKNDHCLAQIEALMTSYRVSVVLLEDLSRGTRRSARIKTLVRLIQARARARRIRCHQIAASAVREAFAPHSKTKHAIALRIAEYFPELRVRLPRIRKPWMSEDERMNIFDAAALALTFVACNEASLPVIRF
jgi:hypothetical protein